MQQIVRASSVCILIALLLPAASGETVEWIRESGSYFSAPTLYPHSSAATGIAVAEGKKVLLLRGDGSVQMEATLHGDIMTPVTLADLDGDSAVELIVILSQGDVVCVSHTGKELWRYQIGSQSGGFENAVAADVHPSPGLEVLAGLDDGWLYCLSARGHLLWRFYGDRFRVGPIAVGDIDADGAPEIVYGTDNGRVYCLTGHGFVKWRFEERAPYGRSGPNLADLDRDGKAEVLITRSNVDRHTCLIAIDHSGRLVWRTEDVAQGYVSNATADLEGDGTLETFHCDKAGNVYCENHDGARRWSARFEGHGIFFAPAVADLDGDGSPEVVVGQRMSGAGQPGLQIIGADGVVKPHPDVTGGTNASPAVGDIDGDGELELVATMQFPNRLVCMTWNAGGRVGWPSLRGNSPMTGADPSVSPGAPIQEPKMKPSGEATLTADEAYWGDNSWSVSWKEPARQDCFVEFAATARDGMRQVVVQDVKEGATVADVKCRLAGAGPFAVTVRLMSNQVSAPVFVATATLEPRPPDFCHYADVEEAVNIALAVSRKARTKSTSLSAELLGLLAQRNDVKRMQQRRAPSGEIATAATALRAQAGYLLKKVRLLGSLWEKGDTGAFVVWQDMNPWDPFDPKDTPENAWTWPVVEHGYAADVDEPLPSEKPVKIEAYGSEFENVALTLINTTAKPIYLRCTFQRPLRSSWSAPAKSPELAKHVTLHRLLPVSAAWSEIVYDALPELDLSGIIEVVPGEAAQLWLTIKTHGLQPGTHRLTLYIGTVAEKDNLTFREVPIEIHVWPISLPTDKYQMMNWTRLDWNSDQAIQNMMDHGMSVIYGPSLPAVPVDEHGNLAGEVDWSRFDQQIARVPAHWQFLWGSHPTPRFPESVNVPGRRDPGYQEWLERELYFTAVKTAIAELVKHLESLGIGYDRWGFYPIDEPWLTGFTLIPELRRFCTLTKRADPNVRNYADPANLVRIQYIQEFKELIDIWQPELNVLKRDPELVKWFQHNARTFWFYEAPGPAKDLLPLGHYRTFPWLAWHFGTTGHGFWVYKMVDMWWARQNAGYGAVYQTGHDVVTSRRWEAARDGVEDWRALYVLRQEIDKARAAGKVAHADAAQALIDEAVQAVVGYHLKYIDEITRATRDYEIDYHLLMKYRTRIAEETLRLRGL